MVIGRKKIYYGWIIVAVGVIMMMSYGIVNNCISLYVVPIFGGGHAGIRRIIEPLSGHTHKKVHARRRGHAERSLLLLFLCG